MLRSLLALLRRIGSVNCILVLGGLVGCSTIHYPVNAPLENASQASGYRIGQVVRTPGDEELFVILTFSGGGTRAAAMAYGVLEELGRNEVQWRGKRKRVLDEVDLVYGVSGGSITAAYWALHGDRTFTDFEPQFLARNLQAQLIDSATSLKSLWRLGSNRYGRGELLEARLDEGLFHGATFSDLSRRKEGPFVIISAADLSNGSRFDFTQDYFDLLCSDLDAFPISRAVAASSSVPLLFSPITLWNYAGSCGYRPSDLVAAASVKSVPRHLGESREQQRIREVAAYLDAKQRPYVHLVDGGIADNLAVRGILELAERSRNGAPREKDENPLRIHKLLFITVDAGTDSATQISKSPDTPRIGDVVEALADIPIQRFSTETRLLLQAAFQKWRSQTTAGSTAPSLYTVEVSLRSVSDEVARHDLMRLPTTLFLPKEDVQELRDIAARLVRESPDFKKLMNEIGVKAIGLSDAKEP